MKYFKVTYGYCPSRRECSIVIAESKAEVVEIISESIEYLYDEDDEDDCIKVVEHDPKNEDEMKIEEIELKRGIVYTGKFCC